MTIQITDANFESLIKSSKPIVIDLWATWCGPCKQFAPTFDRLAKEFEGKVIFGKVDVDSNPGITAKMKIRTVPTIIFFKNGNVVGKSGIAPYATLQATIKSIL